MVAVGKETAGLFFPLPQTGAKSQLLHVAVDIYSHLNIGKKPLPMQAFQVFFPMVTPHLSLSLFHIQSNPVLRTNSCIILGLLKDVWATWTDSSDILATIAFMAWKSTKHKAEMAEMLQGKSIRHRYLLSWVAHSLRLKANHTSELITQDRLAFIVLKTIKP